MLEALVKAHLTQHDADPDRSLAGLDTTVVVRSLLRNLDDEAARTHFAPHRVSMPTADEAARRGRELATRRRQGGGSTPCAS